MPSGLDEQVIDFHADLFERLFYRRFEAKLDELLRRRSVRRQVEEAADAASQSLVRFFAHQQLEQRSAERVLIALRPLPDLVSFETVANPNLLPELVVADLLSQLRGPSSGDQPRLAAHYRVVLHSVVQVLMLVAPVMAEWERLHFSGTYGVLQRVVQRLNQISEQLDALGGSQQAAADERYELSYRDYLLQRFYRIEAGTLRMTVNLSVDVRELFVMPKLRVHSGGGHPAGQVAADSDGELLSLAEARRLIERQHTFRVTRRRGEELLVQDRAPELSSVSALDQVRGPTRNVIVGPPGSGKSTFLEWLQLQIASAEEHLVAGEQQAIPLLLRVRHLNPRRLPGGAGLIEAATQSRDRAALMPPGWIKRQLEAGRVLFMLDGLDETEPGMRNRFLLPWLAELCDRYPQCRYLVSSRPVGYPPEALQPLGFHECHLLEFEEEDVKAYAQHWCTAVRLARNEPPDEARREGEREALTILDGLRAHPYVRNLARNPLMLSAICLVNYFEGGELPRDRVLLYRLCVEGLLHHWDQRRGIRSAFTLEEKLRVCREVATAVQAENRAEYEAGKVKGIFQRTLRDPARGGALFDHVRYRSGLLLERRPGVFAFAHLTFQEYLAAMGVHEANHLGIEVEDLVRDHADPRWREVIPLYCGLAPAPVARSVLEALMASPDSRALSGVLTDAYLSAGAELREDPTLRQRVIRRVAIAPVSDFHDAGLDAFQPGEVAGLANEVVGTIESDIAVSEAHHWLAANPDHLDSSAVFGRLRRWRQLTPFQAGELVHLVHFQAPDDVLFKVAEDADLYSVPGPWDYRRLGEVAFLGLSSRLAVLGDRPSGRRAQKEPLQHHDGFYLALLRSLRSLLPLQGSPLVGENGVLRWQFWLEGIRVLPSPTEPAVARDLAAAVRALAEELRAFPPLKGFKRPSSALEAWADQLKRADKKDASRSSATPSRRKRAKDKSRSSSPEAPR